MTLRERKTLAPRGAGSVGPGGGSASYAATAMRSKGKPMLHGRSRAFTLVEILIVVVLLGILAGVVIPQFSDTVTQARATNLRENLSKIRAHIQVYRNQHAGYPSAARIGDQLTKCTDFSGDVSAASDTTHVYGPYIEQMPANPLMNLRTIRGSSGAAERFTPPSTDGGWWYNEDTGEFFADLTDAHVDDRGAPFNQY